MLIELTSEKEAVLIEGQEIARSGVKILQKSCPRTVSSEQLTDNCSTHCIFLTKLPPR